MTARKIKLLRVLRGLPIGGLERRTLDVLDALQRTGDFDCRIVTILEKGELFAQAQSLGIPTQFIPVLHRFHWKGLMALRRYIAAERFDIVHTQSFYPNVPGRVAALLAGVPAIVAQHHNLFSRKCRRWKHKFYERQLARWTTRIVCVSKAVMDDYLSATGISPGKVEVIYNGIHLDVFEKPQDVRGLREELAITTPFVVGLIARLTPTKDPLTFLRAADLVACARSDVTFLLVGDGKPEYRAKLERLADAGGLRGRVRLTGVRRDVPGIIQLCDVGVLTSRYEGLPGVVIEFFAAGKPMIVTDVPGPREIVTPEQDALVVPPRDPPALARALLRLLEDAGLRSRLGAAARRRAADFSLDRMVENYAALYRGLCRKTAGPGKE
ncbi:MAG: glycosyltransferase family 4 protein [Candidatus Sumerlaeia bacterium]